MLAIASSNHKSFTRASTASRVLLACNCFKYSQRSRIEWKNSEDCEWCSIEEEAWWFGKFLHPASRCTLKTWWFKGLQTSWPFCVRHKWNAWWCSSMCTTTMMYGILPTLLQSLPGRSTLEEEDHHHPAVNVHIKHYANLSLRSHHFPVWICSNGPLHWKAAVIRVGLCEPLVVCSRTDTRSETSQRSAEPRVASACRLEFGPSSSPSLPPPPRPFT